MVNLSSKRLRTDSRLSEPMLWTASTASSIPSTIKPVTPCWIISGTEPCGTLSINGETWAILIPGLLSASLWHELRKGLLSSFPRRLLLSAPGPHARSIAKEVFAVLETGRQIAPFSKAGPDFGLNEARNGAHIGHGVAANVLDGPLFALRHLAEALAQDPLSPPLGAGEIATIGTLTRAFPVAAGEERSTKLSGIPLEGARIRFVLIERAWAIESSLTPSHAIQNDFNVIPAS
jgi:hypothetical protein